MPRYGIIKAFNGSGQHGVYSASIQHLGVAHRRHRILSQENSNFGHDLMSKLRNSPVRGETTQFTAN